MAFSLLFRNVGTFRNYFAGLKLACHAVGIEADDVFSHPFIKRAKAAVVKRAPPPRAKKFITFAMVESFVQRAVCESDISSAMLYILAYAFMLRVPSEALPLTTGDEDLEMRSGRHSSVPLSATAITIHVAKRKNRPHGIA